MTNTFVQPGDVINHTAAGAIASGDVVVLKHTLGVALSAAAAAGAVIAVAVEGVFTVPKVSAAVFVVGEKLLFDASAAAFDDSAAVAAAGDILGAAVAWAAGAAAETTAKVKLTPGNATLT